MQFVSLISCITRHQYHTTTGSKLIFFIIIIIIGAPPVDAECMTARREAEYAQAVTFLLTDTDRLQVIHLL
jgi:hypothetical protein